MRKSNILFIVACTLLATCSIISCQDKKPEPGSSKTKPCEGETVLTHSYTECQGDGFWHSVTDRYLICRDDNKEHVFRVRDAATTTKCDGSAARPSVIGNGYTHVNTLPPHADTNCYKTEQIVISECESGKWVERKYNVLTCPDRPGSYIEPSNEPPVHTGVSCSDKVPVPKH